MDSLRVPLSRPSILPEDLEAVAEVLRSGWLTHGEYNRKFEQTFVERLGVAQAVSLNSCTSALELALKISGVKGEVVLPSMTFVATANAVVTQGGRPVFCEVDPATRNVTAQTIEQALTSRTEAVIVVHFAGQACPMDEIVHLCQRRRLALIEDCAQALGACWQSRPAGSYSLGCFSFFPTKNITTGEGGMLTCPTEEQARRVRILAAHGIRLATLDRARAEKPWYREAEEAGYNYRLAHPLAALGYRQMLRLDEMNCRRAEIARYYNEALKDLAPEVETPMTAPGATHVYQMYTLQVPAAWRDRLLGELRVRGVEASVHFDPPAHLHSFYRQRFPTSLPVTERLAKELVTLPLYPDMTEAEREWVVRSLREIVEQQVYASRNG